LQEVALSERGLELLERCPGAVDVNPIVLDAASTTSTGRPVAPWANGSTRLRSANVASLTRN
jgi:hypothetical protein